MTTTTPTRPEAAIRTGPALGVTRARVLRSEWTKFRSLKSTVWTLLVAVVLMVGLAVTFAAVSAAMYDGFTSQQQADWSAVGTGLSGLTFAQLAIGVLGVLMVTGEYSTGMIRATLTVVPLRLPVLWGKLGVFAVAVLALSLATTFASFLLAQALLSTEGLDVSLSADGVLRSVAGAAVYLTLVGMIGIAVGSLVRSTAGGITTVLGAFFVLPPLVQLLPESWTSTFVQYLPSNAGAAVYDGTQGVDDPLSPGAGLAVLCAYAVALIAAAAWRLRTADA